MPGIGKKRATELVCAYPDFEALSGGEMCFLPQKARQGVRDSLDVIERNMRLIMLEEKPIEGYDACFDTERILETNSRILSACHVFD